MSRSRAIRSGATAIIRQPLVMLAELAWRWTLATALLVLGAYSVLLFLHSLPVTDRDMFGLSGVIPALFWQTLAHIFSGSGPKMVRIAIILSVGFSLLWWLAASFGRAATLRVLAQTTTQAQATGESQETISRLRMRTVFAFNGLRVLLGFTAAMAYVAAFLLAFSASGMSAETGGGTSGAAGKFYLLFFPLALLIGTTWSLLSWYLSLAPIVAAATPAYSRPSPSFAPRAVSSVLDAAMLCRRQPAQFAWVGFVLGCLRLALYAAAWFVLLAIVGLLAALPGGIVLGVLLLLALLYSLVSTAVNLVRVAAYLRIVEWDAEAQAAPPPLIVEPPIATPPAPAETEFPSLSQFPTEPPPEPVS